MVAFISESQSHRRYYDGPTSSRVRVGPALAHPGAENALALSVPAPLFGFMGHLEASGRKFTSAVGALDRSAGIAAASGAELVGFHPGFLLGRSHEDAIDAVVEQLGT